MERTPIEGQRRLTEGGTTTPATRTDYNRGCRTPECRAANAAYQQRRLRRKVPTLVAAGRTREHLRLLLGAGMTIRKIAEQAGTSPATIYRLLGLARGRKRQRRIRPALESRILCVIPDSVERDTSRPAEPRKGGPWWLDLAIAPPSDPDRSWRQHAACRDPSIPTRVFFAYRGDIETMRAAQKICAGCTVRVQCLNYALAVEPEGIWGGTTHQQRERMKGRRGGVDAEAVA